MELFTSLLPHAVAVALSPLPIAALVLLLLSKKAKLNSLLFLFGWMLAVIINVGAFMIIFNKPLNTDASKPEYVVLLNLFLGIVLVGLAVKEWTMRPKPGVLPKKPEWMNAIENMSPFMAFLIAFGLVTINAKNTIIDVSSGVMIGQNSSSLHEAIIALIIYTFIASFTIILPVFGFFILGDKINGKLEDLKSWFLYHNASILFILFLILGLNLIAKAFKG